MIPDVMYLVQQVLSHHNKFTSFVRYANSLILEDILTFRLDYCKIKKLPKAAWVGENCMAFMRLMSYLYGSYLMNNPLSANEDETKETVTNLKCMINAFQALVSVLMTKRAVTPTSIKNHMKLFMSSAHYLHMKYGNMNRKSKQPDVTSETRPGNKRKRGNPKDYVSTLNMADLSTFLGEFNLHDDDAKKELRKRVRQIVVATLKAKLISWNLSTVGTKEDLQKRVMGHLAPTTTDEDTAESDGEDNQGQQARRAKGEKRCWNKGNWVSFLANVSGQVKYLGPLTLIW